MADLQKSDFDFIVIGGGSAGCVMANRLSADPAARVALIEAGPSDLDFPTSLKTRLPAGMLFLLPHDKYNWKYSFAPHTGVNDRELPCPRGKLLGGCSSVNGSVYIRGHRLDYDDWAALGNEGWAWNDVLPVFKGQEDHQQGDSHWHGRGGELRVEVPDNINPLSHAFVRAAVSLGHAHSLDPNGAEQDGFGLTHATQRNGVRSSASRSFLHPVWERPNLTVLTGTLVERILMHKGRATGVAIRRDGQREELTAACEVVLSGGAINSPQLLMLSGIGPAAHLSAHGIEVVHDMPGVGANLQDHPTVQVSNLNPTAESYAYSMRTMPRIATAPLNYLFRRRGMLASNAAEAGGFMRTQPGLDRPDIQMTFVVGLKAAVAKLPAVHGMMLMVHLMRPSSRGRLVLRSSNPTDRPLLHPDFLAHQADIDTLMRGVREARRILAAQPLASFTGEEVTPGAAFQSDVELEFAIRNQVGTAYHPVGTCKMGPSHDGMAVVDARLAVHGIEGLRVVDASVMPNIIGGNTNAPTMMIAEQAARFMREPQRNRNAAFIRPREPQMQSVTEAA
ncbi:MAG: alkJ [Variovorax sp.]|nr:alkJ [Variovorax sp.]